MPGGSGFQLQAEAEKRLCRAGLHDGPAQRQIDREDEILTGGIIENLIAQHNALRALRHEPESWFSQQGRLSQIRERRRRQIRRRNHDDGEGPVCLRRLRMAGDQRP